MMQKPNRNSLHTSTRLGDRISDNVVALVGSWTFIIVQSFFLVVWIIFNVVALGIFHWDPYPFILLNLTLSFQAGFTGPFVLMSQNRQSARDRQRDNLEASEVDEIYNLHTELLEINKRQLAILELLGAKKQPTTSSKKTTQGVQAS